jgi:hypothetical protein
MLPQVELLACPRGRGRDTVPFLESMGLFPCIPAINSGAYETALHDPFRYYLRHRLRITRALSWSKACARGSWTHKALELHDFSKPLGALSELHISPAYASVLAARKEELSALCAAQNMHGDTVATILEREEKDALCAWAWFHTAASLPVGDYGTLHKFIARHRILGREVHLVYNDPLFPRTPLICHLDLLFYNPETNTVWVLDLKTCDESPVIRLQTTKLEFQTWHYLYIVRALMAHLVRHFSLPADAKFGGMVHAAIQKPTIEMGLNDRDFELVDFTPSRGPNKGVTRQEKVYKGEPRLSNYMIRTAHWYRSSGDYSHLATARAKDPPVNMIHTPAAMLDEDLTAEYHERVRLVREYALREAYPGNFPRSASSLINYKKLHDLAPLSLTDPCDWPPIFREMGYITRTLEERVPLDGVQQESPQEEPAAPEA